MFTKSLETDFWSQKWDIKLKIGKNEDEYVRKGCLLGLLQSNSILDYQWDYV